MKYYKSNMGQMKRNIKKTKTIKAENVSNRQLSELLL